MAESLARRAAVTKASAGCKLGSGSRIPPFETCISRDQLRLPSTQRELPVKCSRFLINEVLWQAISARIKAPKRIDAGIAYFGQGGAKLLPLRSGDRLVVDMSLTTVKAGGTDPREVEKLIRHGVQAFTRRNLHAKIVVADRSVIVGSANVSGRSVRDLDEAAILTSDPSAIRRAREFIDRICTEPIRPDYLEVCKRIYRPPRFGGQRARAEGNGRRAAHAKLWLVKLREYELPASERERFEEGESKAATSVRDQVRSTTDSFHWPHKPKMAQEPEPAGWIIQVVTLEDKNTIVGPPGQLLFARRRNSGRSSFATDCHRSPYHSGPSMAPPTLIFRKRSTEPTTAPAMSTSFTPASPNRASLRPTQNGCGSLSLQAVNTIDAPAPQSCPRATARCA